MERRAKLGPSAAIPGARPATDAHPLMTGATELLSPMGAGAGALVPEARRDDGMSSVSSSAAVFPASSGSCVRKQEPRGSPL
eukprot:scaffold1112_cov116-Isochrysis_galbana.AAC.36